MTVTSTKPISCGIILDFGVTEVTLEVTLKTICIDIIYSIVTSVTSKNNYPYEREKREISLIYTCNPEVTEVTEQENSQQIFLFGLPHGLPRYLSEGLSEGKSACANAYSGYPSKPFDGTLSPLEWTP